ncbi:MAG: COX15/CtaA family protein [Devosiaceae bacterium]|nr:COX15/CtaA family protein [Devosiaceae bacterium]
MTHSVQSAINSLPADGPDRLRPVRIWLYVLAAAILALVAVGGLTRLTDSGLSITSWKPISGMLPPLSAQDWQAEFEAYKLIPEFIKQNYWMELSDFKFIFWWEWGHRFLGRMIGLIFAVPFVIFLVQGRLSKKLAPSLALLFVLGGFQGFLGWWMVSSGLTARVDVSQYRLAAHLGAASILFAAIVWVARRLEPKTSSASYMKASSGGRLALKFMALLVFIQIIKGAFVAGLDAGYAFNTWPLMEGSWIPAGLLAMQPAWLNLFENLLTVQFSHRMLGYVIGIFGLIMLAYGFRKRSSLLSGWMRIIGIVIILQIILGIVTLVLVVPMPLALGHQALAFVLFASIFAALADTSSKPPLA